MRCFVPRQKSDPENDSTLSDKKTPGDKSRDLRQTVVDNDPLNGCVAAEAGTHAFFCKALLWVAFVALVIAVAVSMRMAASLPDYEKKLALDSVTHSVNLFFSLAWIALFFVLTQKLPLWGRGIVFVVFFLPVAFSFYLRNYYGMEIDFSFIMDCINTHWEEARGFISLHAIGILVTFVAVMFAMAWIVGNIPTKLPKSKIFVLGLVALLVLSAYLPSNLRACIFPAKVAHDIKESLMLYKNSNLGFELLAKQECEKQEVFHVPAGISHVNAVPVVVLHIAESARADHAPFNGYCRNTMPNMLKEYELGNLISFPKCVSFSVRTTLSLLGIMSPSTVLDNAFRHPTFIPLLNQNGIKTCLFISEFRPNGKDIHDIWLDHIFGRVQEIFSTQKPDLSLLPKIREKLAEDAKQNPIRGRFYLYYGEGSHAPFTHYDYTKHAVFKPTGTRICNDDRDVNNYDNTFIATDEFCSGFMDVLRDENAVYIFVGDHGTMVGEDGLQGRPYRRPESRHVLFFIWVSEKFKTENPELWATLLHNQERLGVVSHDFVYNSVLHLFSLETPFYNEKADLFSESAEAFPTEMPDAKEFGPIKFGEDTEPVYMGFERDWKES